MDAILKTVAQRESCLYALVELGLRGVYEAAGGRCRQGTERADLDMRLHVFRETRTIRYKRSSVYSAKKI